MSLEKEMRPEQSEAPQHADHDNGVITGHQQYIAHDRSRGVKGNSHSLHI